MGLAAGRRGLMLWFGLVLAGCGKAEPPAGDDSSRAQAGAAGAADGRDAGAGAGGAAQCPCPEQPLDFQYVEQSLDCYCDSSYCPDSFEAALANLENECNLNVTVRVLSGCGILSVRFDSLYGAAYHFDSESGELIGASHHDDIPAEPCGQFGLSTGVMPDCDEATECSPCEDEPVRQGLPLCE